MRNPKNASLSARRGLISDRSSSTSTTSPKPSPMRKAKGLSDPDRRQNYRLDDGVHVAEARVIGARNDARHGRGRALALIDGHVELLGGEIALVLRPVVPGVHALDLPVEREADLGGLLREGRCRENEAG